MKILVISDIHGNASALRAVAKRERDVDATIFLGDAVLSGPQSNAVMELLSELQPAVSLMGNHDVEVLDPALFAGWPPEWVALNTWIIENLDAAVPHVINKWKRSHDFEIDGLHFFLHHGDIKNGAESPLPDASDATFEILKQGDHSSTVLFGHTHVQFEKLVNGVNFINPGSVGQSRCGKRVACYGIFQDGIYEPRQVDYEPGDWLGDLEKIQILDDYPNFKEWLIEGFLSGFGLGQRDPWQKYGQQGYL